jgi:hypothetical protein
VYKVFVSYRRDDSAGHAGRLFDSLTSRFGAGSVFMDRASIHAGTDFENITLQALRSSEVLVAVIGTAWVSILNQRASSTETDYTRLELTEALRCKMHIIPVMVDGAVPPKQNEVPEDLVPLVRLHVLELLDSHYRATFADLVDTIERLGQKPGQDPRAEPLSVAGLGDALDWGWSGADLTKKLMEIDYETVEGLTPDYVGSPEQWTPILVDHPDTWRLLVDRPGSIVGNWHFVSLYAEDFDKARNGQLTERDITADRVRYLDMLGWHDIFFLAVFLVPRFRGAHNLIMLRKTILDHFLYLARQGIFIRTVCANAYSISGKGFCRSFHLEGRGQNIVHGTMYERAVYPLPDDPLFHPYSELNDLYRKALASSGGPRAL